MSLNKELKTRPEAEDQAAVIDWAWTHAPMQGVESARMLYAIPNGARLGTKKQLAVLEASRLKKQGLKLGMPDLCLPVCRLGFHSLYIEMKRWGGDWTLTGEQKERAKELARHRNLVALCQGSDAAITLILQYLASDPRLRREAFSRYSEGYSYVRRR